MNNYNFSTQLSPLRFEQLVRDLLQERYGIFENFAEGKDGGIDFRYSNSDKSILIVQCKRYKDVKTLINNLKKEAAKAHNISFTEYILATSLDLTDTNKQDILRLYKGKIQNPKQIITNKDLNALLGLPSNHFVEFKYPELWMNSINIHQKLFNLGLLNHSLFIRDELQNSLKSFVPYKQYYEVLEHLKDNNVVIISGNPGVGKSTLAHAVISNFIFFQDYQLIDFTARKFQDAEPFLYTNDPTIFFIDDFLGQIKLEKDNDYSRLLLYFIKKIEKIKNKKLVITSREYILKKANKELFPIEEINQIIQKYVIELNSFTRRIRTEILYNHLKNSDLPTDFIEHFLKSNFKRVIDNNNYNPRIIEHLTDIKRLKNISPEQYYNFFVTNLENPSEIWKHVYNNLPNDLYKIILLIRFVISEPLPIECLEKTINYLINNDSRFKQYSFDDFGHIIKEFEGTFFKFPIDYDEMVEEEYTLIEFQNPSIKDFIDSFIWKEYYWLGLIIQNAIYFEQLFNWELLDAVKENNELLDIYLNKVVNDFHKLENASIGYFEYDAPDEGSFTCWRPERYNHYLEQLANMFDFSEIKHSEKVYHLLKKEIFKYPFHGAEDISEKIAFLQVAELLLDKGIIKSEDAINHYLIGYCDNIKELVFLEYMSRSCSKESLKIIRNNKRLKQEADFLFLNEIENIEEKDFLDLMEFLDDYTQIKFILPLTKTTKKLNELNLDELYKKARFTNEKDDLLNEKKVKDTENYYDISDNSIEELLKTLQSN